MQFPFSKSLIGSSLIRNVRFSQITLGSTATCFTHNTALLTPLTLPLFAFKPLFYSLIYFMYVCIYLFIHSSIYLLLQGPELGWLEQLQIGLRDGSLRTMSWALVVTVNQVLSFFSTGCPLGKNAIEVYIAHLWHLSWHGWTAWDLLGISLFMVLLHVTIRIS